MPHRPRRRPLPELDVGHQRGLDPAGLGVGDAVSEGAGVTGQGRQQLVQPVQGGVAEAGPHPPGEAQRGALVVPGQEGPDAALTVARAGQPAADDDLLAQVVLDLDPAARAPARLVGRAQALGHHALQTLAAGHLEQVGPAAHVRGRHLHAGATEGQVLERPAALGVGRLDERAPVQPEQVEGHVDHGDLGHAQADRLGPGQVHAVLQLAEAGPALVVEGDHLAVDDGRVRSEQRRQLVHLGVAGRDVGPPAAVQADGAGGAVDVGEDAHAVPLDLVGVGRVVAGQGPRRRQHGQQPMGHGRGRRAAQAWITTRRSSVISLTAQAGPSLVLPLALTPP